MQNSLNKLIIAIAIIGLLGLILSGVAALGAGLDTGFSRSLCATNECFKRAFSIYSSSIFIAWATIRLLIGGATVGGILIALMNYVNTARSNALSNHISHLSIFKDFIDFETKKRPMVAMESLDAFRWYNTIYKDSRNGVMEVSKDYKKLINEINSEIEYSNAQTKYARGGSFRYKPHQKRIIPILEKIGIYMSHAPRNDFFQAEGEVFSLIRSVNNEFCYSYDLPSIKDRNYI